MVMKRTYIRVTYVAMSPYGKPIVTAHTQKDLKAGLDEYYGIGKDSKAKYLDWTPYVSKYPDDFEGTYRYEVDDFNGGLELEEVKVYCIDFYPETKYEVEDKQEQKQVLIDMMKHDEELGLYIINDVTSMATLETQYKMYLEKNPDSKWTYDEWLKWHSEWLAESIKNIDPTVSDDFQIGPDGAYEATEEFELYQKYTDEFAGYEDVPSYEWFKHELENNETFRKRYGKDNTRI